MLALTAHVRKEKISNIVIKIGRILSLYIYDNINNYWRYDMKKNKVNPDRIIQTTQENFKDVLSKKMLCPYGVKMAFWHNCRMGKWF